MLRSEGDLVAAEAVLSEIVQAWPLIVAAPSWKGFATPFATTEILEVAHDRWIHGLTSPEPLVSQPLLLGVMIGLTDADLDRARARLSPTLREAYVAVMRCDPDAAVALRSASDADRRTATYWALAIRLGRLEGGMTRDYQRLYRLMTSDLLLTDRELPALNPLQENGIRASNSDIWGYRRQPIDWPNTRWDLPSPTAGFARWHREPVGAMREADIEEVLDECPAE
jgi:hypothetical protein